MTRPTILDAIDAALVTTLPEGIVAVVNSEDANKLLDYLEVRDTRRFQRGCRYNDVNITVSTAQLDAPGWVIWTHDHLKRNISE